jgi:hypothetical protein
MTMWEANKLKDATIPKNNHCCDCKYATYDMDGNFCGHKESFQGSNFFCASCQSARREGNFCGPDGKLFVEKSL